MRKKRSPLHYSSGFFSDLNEPGLNQPYDYDWQPIKDLPNLFDEKIIGLDIETKDPNLTTHGPGWGYGDGNIVGISLSTEFESWYFPVAHEVGAHQNMDKDNVYRYLSDLLSLNTIKVGANLMYDIGWLLHEGIPVKGKFYDVQFAEAVLDDTAQSYSLDTIAHTYLRVGKQKSELQQWIMNGENPPAKDFREAIYRAPPVLVDAYARSDASLPLSIIKQQWKKLKKEELLDVFKLECRLIPVLIAMRNRGMLVDITSTVQAEDYLLDKISSLHDELEQFAGSKIKVNSNKDIEWMFKKFKEPYQKTSAGNASFTKDWLSINQFKGAKLIYNIRRYEKVLSTFIRGSILEMSKNGVLRPSLHPLRGEEGGAVSGRFSCSKPNGQQFPSRDDELAPIIRGIFHPAEGCEWLKMDYSQIEYRLFAHYSNDDRLIEAYKDPTTDFHALVGSFLGKKDLNRTAIKNINFGLLYGMGKDKLLKILTTNELDMDADDFLNLYHERFPAARRVSSESSKYAAKHGEVRTILGRRNTFNLYEPINAEGTPLPYIQAVKEYGPMVQRSHTHKALNRRLQGSAADIMKKAMVDIYEEGLFDRVGAPHITVHDELDWSYHKDLHSDFVYIKEIMENTIALNVPLMVSCEKGPNWGNLEEFEL